MDLVKAYDTVNHELLFLILEKFGVPPFLIDIIKRLYKDLKIKFKLGKSMTEILQTVGVRQGDNMAPVLFLFLMAAISQVIDQEFEQNSIEKIEFLRKSDDKYHEGQIFRHDVRKCVLSENLTQVVIRHLAYVDDEGFPFTSREQLALGTNIINRVFKMFGVEMHTGKRDSTTGKFSKSKTEAVYFPRRSFWHQEALSAGVAEEDAAAIVSETDNEPETQRERRQNTEQAIYAAHSNTQPIVLESDNERITFTFNFTYLGRVFSGNLRDCEAIRTRIAKANAAFACLVKFFKRKEIKLDYKKKIFEGICVNLLLWGCESWALRVDHIRDLEVWLHRKIRKILGITIYQVMDDHSLKNDHIRKMFGDSNSIQTMIDVRRMKLLGDIVQGKNSVGCPARQMLIAFSAHPREVAGGRPLKSNKESLHDSLARSLKKVGFTIDRSGSLKDWYWDFLNPTFVSELIAFLKDSSKPIPRRSNPGSQYTYHPRYSSRHSDSRRAEQDRNARERQQRRQQRHEDHRRRQEERRQQQQDHRQQRGGMSESPSRSRPFSGIDPDLDPSNMEWNLGRAHRVLGNIGRNATSREIKTAYRLESRRWHPDHHVGKPSFKEAEARMQTINAAYEYLRELSRT